MPELPDVAQFKRYFDATALHRRIEKMAVQDTRILDGVSTRKLHAVLKGDSFVSTYRHGKHLFVHTRKRRIVRLHFGMTGTLKYFKEMASEPSHDRVRVDFSNGWHLAFISQRMLGGIGLIDDIDAFIKEKRLGPDARRVDLETFRTVLAGRRGSLKSALMNQGVVAGLGNVYSDEVLFQARLHPESTPGRIGIDRLRQLFDAMKFVLEIAIERRADARNLPADFLVHYRHENAACPRCSASIRPIHIAGRRAWCCAGCQERIS